MSIGKETSHWLPCSSTFLCMRVSIREAGVGPQNTRSEEVIQNEATPHLQLVHSANTNYL